MGLFDIPPAIAKQMLASPNPHSQPNALVIFPLVNADDIMRRPRGRYIIDFGVRDEEEAALFEDPFEYVKKHEKPLRDKNRDKQRRLNWWRHGRAGTHLSAALSSKTRQLVTPRVSKFRVFRWVPSDMVVSDAVVAVARDDDYFFGVLQSRVHEIWSLKQGTQLESRPRYTPTSSFETFPFPRPTDAQQEAIAKAAKELNEWRTAWLNPSDDGLGMTTGERNKRTLTNLYNQRPAWLDNAHATLDAAVVESYGWPEPPAQLSDQEILGRLLALNLQREPA